MHRSLTSLSVLLALCAGLAACSGAMPGSTSGGPPTSTTSAPVPSPPAPTSAQPSTGSGASGEIRFTGAVAGTMTVSSCPDGAPAQLVVTVEGEPKRFAGVIDTDDFAFVGPGSSGFTLDQGQPKPTRSGKTYTVRHVRMIGVMDERTVMADGSATCP